MISNSRSIGRVQHINVHGDVAAVELREELRDPRTRLLEPCLPYVLRGHYFYIRTFREVQLWLGKGPNAHLHQVVWTEMFDDTSHESSVRRSEEHTSELQSPYDLVCRLLLEKKKKEN